MNVYIYQADIYCEACGEAIQRQIALDGNLPDNPKDEHTFDSDDYPKGPYGDGGGEADTPQHCSACGLFLENPLTQDGYDYVRESIGEGRNKVTELWAKFYDVETEASE